MHSENLVKMYSGCSLVAEETAPYARGSQDAANPHCSTKVHASHLNSAPLKNQSKMWFTEWLCCFILCIFHYCFCKRRQADSRRSLENHEKRVFFDSKAGLHCHSPKTLRKLHHFQTPQFPRDHCAALSYNFWLKICDIFHTAPQPIFGPLHVAWTTTHPQNAAQEQAVNPLPSLSPSFHQRGGFYIASYFMFCISFHVQNTFLRVAGVFVFLAIHRPDSPLDF